MFLQYYRSISAILLLSAFQICDLQAIKPVGLSKNDKNGSTRKNFLIKKVALSALGAGLVLLPCGLFLAYKIKNNGTQEPTESRGPGGISPEGTPRPQLPSRNPAITPARPEPRMPVTPEPKTEMERWVFASTLTEEEKYAFDQATGLSWDGLFNMRATSRYRKAQIVPGTRRCAEILEALEFCKQYQLMRHEIAPSEINRLENVKKEACYQLWSKLARECVISHIEDEILFHTKIPPIKALWAAVNEINSERITDHMKVVRILRNIIAKAQPGACPTIERDFPPLERELRALITSS